MLNYNTVMLQILDIRLE